MVESAGEKQSVARSGHPIFARLYPLLEDDEAAGNLFTTFEECQAYTVQLDRTLTEQGEENKELKQVKVANFIASMCVKADKFDRALSFFIKA